MNRFKIPVVLIIFKRMKAIEIVKRIEQVKPEKMYILADGARNDYEQIEVEECRKAVENAITWPCKVIKRYADSNIGVYKNIAEGALWVFERERNAIFLEDDNLPDLTFFQFCEEMLYRYESHTEVLWVCGTNYLERCSFQSGADYGFTHHMLPCGWASWSRKFRQYYDGKFENYSPQILKKLRKSYDSVRLFRQDVRHWKMEIENIKQHGKYSSWDYQMSFSIRYYNLIGIIPNVNLIKNIGVDEYSTHGGTSLDMTMTNRFCSMDAISVKFPLVHPEVISVDPLIEKSLSRIILQPMWYSVRKLLGKAIRFVFSIPDNVSVRKHFTIKS